MWWFAILRSFTAKGWNIFSQPKSTMRTSMAAVFAGLDFSQGLDLILDRSRGP
jgi:hypothetical protein